VALEVGMNIAKRWVVIGAAGTAAMAMGGMTVSNALVSGATHALSFKSIQLKGVNTSSNTFVGIGKDVAKGKVIGGNVLSCKVRPAAHNFACSVSLAIKGGQIYATFILLPNGTNNLQHGKVTGGIGAYKGVTGTITGTSAGHSNENVTVTYHH
jgi:hypothetical protein